MNKKNIYMILWIDDYRGDYSPDKEDIQWYHSNAGPISFIIQEDGVFTNSLDMFFNSKEVVIDLDYDYLSHHFHTWKGNAFLDFIPSLFQNSLKVNQIINRLKTHPRFWKYMYGDTAQIKYILLKTKEKFERYEMEYPEVIRHGWNLPPKNTMEFYMSKMSVLADASANPQRPVKHKGNRKLVWNVGLAPYYCSLSGDYNSQWDGTEEDRGILELPLTLDNIAYYGFGSEETAVIKSLPNEGLISTYIHPHDDFENIKKLILFLNENYNMKYVRADTYVGIYMRNHPRPVFIDKDKMVYWAYIRKNMLPIRPIINTNIISLKAIKEYKYQLSVTTLNPIPVLCLDFSCIIREKDNKVLTDEDEAGTIVRNLKPGDYTVEIIAKNVKGDQP